MIPSLLHIADSHLRPAQWAYSSRGPDFAAALRWCVQYAIDHKIPAITHGGDLINDARPNSQTMKDLCAVHELAAAAGIPIFTVTGNHDWVQPSWIEVISSIYGDKGVGFVCIDRQLVKIPGTEVTIYGLPTLTKEALQVALAEAPKADILVWHGLVKEFVGFPVENAVEIQDFDVGKFRAILLGDIHVWNWCSAGTSGHEDPSKNTHFLIGYPGSTELCEKSEDIEKYAALLSIPEKAVPAPPEQVLIDTRPVRPFRIETEEDLGRIIAELQAETFTRPPILFVAYNPTVISVVSRIKNAAPPEAIVRYAAIDQGKGLSLTDSAAKDRIEAGVLLQDLVKEFLPNGSPLLEISTRLISPDVNAKEVIQGYAFARLQALAADVES
jgi:DNA repair exonuclease SbcCD nuclease subunit